MNDTVLEERIRVLENQLKDLRSGRSVSAQVTDNLPSDESITGYYNQSHQLKNIIATTSEGFWLMNEKGNFLEVNPAFCKLVGFTREELLNMSVFNLEALESKAETELHIKKIFNEGNDRFETIMRCKDGTRINMELNISYLEKTKNQCCAFVHDIQKRKQTEEAIFRQNEALSRLNLFAIELSNLSFEDNLEEFIARNVKVIAGAEFSIFSEYNRDYHTTTTKCIELESGLLQNVIKILGKRVQDVHSPVSEEMYLEMTRDMIGTRKTLNEASFGAISKTASAAIQSVLNVDRFIGLAYIIEGKLYGTSLLGMRKNIPDPPKKILENFIHLAATSLQRKQVERQLKVNIAELQNTNYKLEQYAHANEELEQFAFIASHNLQQPLRTVSNYVQVFEEDYMGKIDDTAHSYLKVVRDSVTRMSLLLNSLLDFSRLGRHLRLTRVNSKKLVNDVIAGLNPLIITSNTRIEMADMPDLYVYESEFSLLFHNLITNAIKFQKHNNLPIIRIWSEKTENEWKFSVSDNGIGIEAKYHEKIFDMFQRLHTDTDYEGRGIGLAFVKKIVQLHKGEIWVESATGQGTTFHFTIASLTE